MKVDNKIYLPVIIISLVIIQACSSNIVLLKGIYAQNPVEITSTKQVDSIWLTITQLFDQNGLSIKKLDKEKGLIVSTKSSFIPAYTFEDENGKLIEPDAWIVLRQVYINNKRLKTKDIFCQWNIQVTDIGKGLSKVRVDPTVVCTYYPNMFMSQEEPGQSTGKLEELLMHSLASK